MRRRDILVKRASCGKDASSTIELGKAETPNVGAAQTALS